MGRWVVVEVVYGFESDVYGGVDERNAVLAFGAEEFEAVVVVAECGGEWVVMRESF